MKNKNVEMMELLINMEDVTKSIPKKITMDNNYLFEIYSIYKNEKIEEIAGNIIKVNLPEDIEKAKQLLKEGFTYNGVEYVSLLTTTGLMKHEDADLNIKCDYFFINKIDQDFKEELENVASCGTLKTLKNKEICINKDIVSRLSLLMSSGQMVYFNKPLKMAILPEMTFTYINNYLQFAEKKFIDEDGKERTVIDKDNLRLEKHPNLEVEHIAMDGSGFMMPHIAKTITDQLNKGYDINWIGFRTLGNAGKGLLVKFDWKEYLREQHGLETLKVKDMWGNEVDLFEVDIVVNETVVKWGKLFDSYEEMIEAREEFKKYDSLFNSLCITKFNKKEPKEYSLTNYQLISNLNLTAKELRELAKEDIETYRKAVIDKDIDTIRVLLGDFANNEEEAEDKRFTPSSKIHQALQLDERLVNCESAKYTIDKMVNKKIHQLAGGRITVKGNYKVIIKDVFSYFDSLINPNYKIKDGKLKGINGAISENGLKAKTNYIPGELGYRTLARCPLNSATEIIKTELVEHELYNKYFGDFASDIIFYAFDDNMMLQSGADEDTDISLVVDNEIIYNSVIEDIDEDGVKWCFRNQFDGKAELREYTEDEMYDSILNTAGNSIGKLSNMGAKISNIIQTTPIIGADEKLVSFDFLYKKWKETQEDYEKAKQETDPEKRKELYINLKNTFIEKMSKYYAKKGFKTEPTEANCKEFLLDRFQQCKKYSYYTLYLQMVAIDSVKTNIKVDKAMLEPLNVLGLKKIKKPLYIYHSKFKEENKVVEYKDVQADRSLLNDFAKEVIREIGSNARNKNKHSNTYLFSVLTKSEENGVVVSEELAAYIKNLYESYTMKTKSINSIVEILKKEKSKLKDEQEIERLNNKIIAEKEIRNNKLNELEILTYDKIKAEIKGKYTNLEMLLAVGKYRDENGHRVKSKFVMDFFFENLIEVLIANANGVMSVYALTDESDNNNIHVLYKDYKKINKSIEVEDINLSEKDILKKKVKLNQAIETRFGGLTDTNLEGKEFTVKKNTFTNKKGEEKDQLQVIIDNTMVGYIFNDKADFVELDKQYKIIGVDTGNRENATSATIYLEVVM